MQPTLVILLVAACTAWLVYLAIRYFRPHSGAHACAGGCCAGQDKPPAPEPHAPPATGTQMISSDDLRARLKARHG